MRSMNQHFTQEFFKKYLNIPYKELDCFELVKRFYSQEFSVEISNDFYPTPKNKKIDEIIDIRDNYNNLVKEQKKKFKKVDTPSYGDIVLIRSWGIPAHVGIYIDEGKFLHTQEKTGSVIEKVSLWNKRILGYYSYDKTKT